MRHPEPHPEATASDLWDLLKESGEAGLSAPAIRIRLAVSNTTFRKGLKVLRQFLGEDSPMNVICDRIDREYRYILSDDLGKAGKHVRRTYLTVVSMQLTAWAFWKSMSRAYDRRKALGRIARDAEMHYRHILEVTDRFKEELISNGIIEVDHQ
jgi:hypothetical protein